MDIWILKYILLGMRIVHLGVEKLNFGLRIIEIWGIKSINVGASVGEGNMNLAGKKTFG